MKRAQDLGTAGLGDGATTCAPPNLPSVVPSAPSDALPMPSNPKRSKALPALESAPQPQLSAQALMPGARRAARIARALDGFAALAWQPPPSPPHLSSLSRTCLLSRICSPTRRQQQQTGQRPRPRRQETATQPSRRRGEAEHGRHAELGSGRRALPAELGHRGRERAFAARSLEPSRGELGAHGRRHRIGRW